MTPIAWTGAADGRSTPARTEVVAMPASPAGRNTQEKINPRFLPVIDRVLNTGLKLGPAGKHEAINKGLQLVPERKRGDCWRRTRQLTTSTPISRIPSCSLEK